MYRAFAVLELRLDLKLMAYSYMLPTKPNHTTLICVIEPHKHGRSASDLKKRHLAYREFMNCCSMASRAVRNNGLRAVQSLRHHTISAGRGRALSPHAATQRVT